MTTEAIRVLIADDQRVVRDGLSMLVALIDGVEVVGTASDGAEAVQLAAAYWPDVIMMDLRMPGTDGISATADLRERLPATRVLVLTTYADEDAILPALRAGARGYLTKDASAEQIEAAIHAVHAGQTYLDPAVQERLVAAVVSQPPVPQQRHGHDAYHRIFAKTGARDRAQAVRYAYQHGMVTTAQ